jgi:hypothetical protein
LLTLADSFRVENFTIFRDVVYHNGEREYRPIFYPLPDAPHIVRDADGSPAFDFLWYRKKPNSESMRPLAGGLVTLTVSLSPAADEKVHLRKQIAARDNLPIESVQLEPIAFKDGSVTLTFAGESGTDEFVQQIAGNGKARLTGSQRASFAIDLSDEGAALLWNTLKLGNNLFRLRYDLVFDHRLDDIELRVWCDAQQAVQMAAVQTERGTLNPKKLGDTLVQKHLAGVEITSTRTMGDDQQMALEKLGQDLLQAALEKALFISREMENADTHFNLRSYEPSMQFLLNHTFTQSYPLEQHVVWDEILQLDLTQEQLNQKVRRVDPSDGFFKVLEVKIYCTVDFTQDPIDKVKVAIEYDATGAGGRIRRQGEYIFQKGVEVQTFTTDLAAPDQRSYRYGVTVFYANKPAPLHLTFPPTETTALIIDVGNLGILKVILELRDVSFKIIRQVVIDLYYPPLDISHTVILDGKQTHKQWQLITRNPPESYQYRVAWITHDNRRLESQWQTSSSHQISLDAPANLSRTVSIHLISAGDFSDVAQLLVDLRPLSDLTTHPSQFTFTQAGQSHAWEPEGMDPSGFQYEVRRTIVYSDGHRRELDWTLEDTPVLVVRNLWRFDVSIVARLLDIGDSIRLALLELQYQDDQERFQAKDTLVLRDRNAEIHWIFHLGAPDRHRYRYRLTFIPTDGPRQTTNWQEAEENILVLRPGNLEGVNHADI